MERDRIFEAYQKEQKEKARLLEGSVEDAVLAVQKMSPSKERSALLEALVAAEQPFVIQIAQRYKTFFNNRMDLVQEGAIGLLKAIERFDPKKIPILKHMQRIGCGHI
jgi:DNA-directed RNA polymerase sigma subunit (sigma70/sigma32)